MLTENMTAKIAGIHGMPGQVAKLNPLSLPLKPVAEHREQYRYRG